MISRLLLAARGNGSFITPPPPAALPADWNLTRYSGNPQTHTTVGEPHEMYIPATFEAPNGDVWMYVKGNAGIYAWLSTDGGETFDFAVGGDQVLSPDTGEWDGSFVLEPTVVFDEANDTIHLWYKGRDLGVNNWQWGHATADISDPTVFTRDPANPIYTKSAAEADLGGTSSDLVITSVGKFPDGFHFYGYAAIDGVYRLIMATGTTWSDPANGQILLTATTDPIVQCPSVFEMPGSGEPLYVMFYAAGGVQPAPRSIYVATSTDGIDWDFSDTTPLLSPTGTGWEEDETYCGQLLRVNADPWLLPNVDGLGRWRFYYSGLEDDVAVAGLAYLEPT